MYKLHIFGYVSFRSCTKPLRNVDHLTLDDPFLMSLRIIFLFGSVTCGMNYLLVLDSQIPRQSFIRI